MNTPSVPRIVLVGAATAILFALAGSASATTENMPIAIPTPDRVVVGYDWDARDHATHLLVSAAPLASTIPLDGVTTPMLDLEIEWLMPHQRYELLGPGRMIPVYANEGGAGIAWNVPAAAGTWVLRDPTGQPYSTFVLTPSSPSTFGAQQRCWWWQDCSRQVEPPKPVSSEKAEGGFAVEQAAYSFTPNAQIRLENCYTHSVTISAKATAGAAGNKVSAGSDLTYVRTECRGFTVADQGMEVKRKTMFRKDNYEDGSYKIYATGETSVLHFEVVQKRYTVHPQAQTILVDAGAHNVTLTFMERNAGGVRYEVGVNVYGVGLAVEFHALGESKATATISFLPPASGTRTFRVHVVNGDGSVTGIVPMVWEEQ